MSQSEAAPFQKRHIHEHVCKCQILRVWWRVFVVFCLVVRYIVFVVVWACAVCYRGDTDGVQIRQLSLGGVMHSYLRVCVCVRT